jgi:hypothetical protein
MSTSPGQDTLASRGLSVLRNMGAWVAINPDQTYVATSIPGLGACKSTYCQPQRRELSAAKIEGSGTLAPLLAVALAALGLLAGCAGYPVAGAHGVSGRGQDARNFTDCQNYAEPVSPGAAAGFGDGFAGLAGSDAVSGQGAGRFAGVENTVAGATGARARAAGSCLAGDDYLVLN